MAVVCIVNVVFACTLVVVIVVDLVFPKLLSILCSSRAPEGVQCKIAFDKLSVVFEGHFPIDQSGFVFGPPDWMRLGSAPSCQIGPTRLASD